MAGSGISGNRSVIGLFLVLVTFYVVYLYDTGRFAYLKAALTAPPGSPLPGAPGTTTPVVPGVVLPAPITAAPAQGPGGSTYTPGIQALPSPVQIPAPGGGVQALPAPGPIPPALPPIAAPGAVPGTLQQPGAYLLPPAQVSTTGWLQQAQSIINSIFGSNTPQFWKPSTLPSTPPIAPTTTTPSTSKPIPTVTVPGGIWV